MPGPERSPPDAPPDPLDRLARFLSGDDPHAVVVAGPTGAGKSTLLHALAARLPGPCLFLAYRPAVPDGAEPAPTEVALTWLGEPPGPTGARFDDAGQVPVPAAALRARDGELPAPVRAAFDRLVGARGGLIVADEWSRTGEGRFSTLSPRPESSLDLVAPVAAVRARLGRIPVHTLVAIAGAPGPQVEAVADGVVELSTEPVDDTELRILKIVRLRGETVDPSRFLYTLTGSRFTVPPPIAVHPRPPPPPEPDPSPEPGSSWPGSEEYARAFGRLRHHGITAIELDAETPHTTIDALLVPIVASVVRAGGRVVWVPIGMGSAARVGRLLTPVLPPEAIAQGVRVLSASPYEPVEPTLMPISLPVRRGVSAASGGRPPTDPTAPVFPEAFRFLRDRRGEGPALFVLSVDGLRSLSAVVGLPYDPATFPQVAAAYARLPRFHGIGLGTAEHPLVRTMLPAVDVHLRAHQRCGTTVLVGIRPRTPPYLVDWSRPDGRYALLPVA